MERSRLDRTFSLAIAEKGWKGNADKTDRVRRQAKAGDFEGTGGPEDKEEEARRVRGGDDEVPGNVRQGGSGGGSGDGRVRVSGASDGFD